MIKIKRPEKIPGVLATRGSRELARWEAYHEARRKGKRKKKPSGFRAYNDAEVVLVLRGMFSNKCAYCETPIAAGDVEHYRPKNAVERDDGTRLEDGYWWLAANWDNLLYSCIACNQNRRIIISGTETLTTRGKGVRFPIANEVQVNGPDDEKAEVPLLLNPVEDSPEEYMTVNVNSEDEHFYCFLQPVGEEGSEQYLKGERTIEILGLNEVTRVDQRRRQLAEIRSRIHRMLRLKKRIQEREPGSERDALMAELRVEMVDLKELYLSPESPYLMLSRQVILPFGKQFIGG